MFTKLIERSKNKISYDMFKVKQNMRWKEMILKELKINTWIGEPTNCYIIFEEETHEAMVVDPAGDVDKIIEMLEILKAKLKYIYLTHCHGDHTGGVNELHDKMGGKVLISRYDAPRFKW